MGTLKMKVLGILAATAPAKQACFKMIFRRDGIPPYKKPVYADNDPRGAVTRKREEQAELGRRALSQRRSEMLTMINDRGSRVNALFVPSEQESKLYVVLSHGYRCDGLREFSAFLPFYLEQPVNLLIVDHQAHGRSEGNVITFGAQEHIDLIAWMHKLIDDHGSDIRIMMHGISMGSATVMQAAGSDKLPAQVRSVLADCGYTSLEEEIKNCLRAFGVGDRVWNGIGETFQKKTGHAADEVNALEAVRRSRIPVHLIHGAADDFVPTAMSETIHREVTSTELILIPGAGHAESWVCAPEIYKALILRCIAELNI